MARESSVGDGMAVRLTRRAAIGGTVLTAVLPSVVAGAPGRRTGLSPFIPGRSYRTTALEPAPTPEPTQEPVWVNGRRYDAYVPAATKTGQWFWYTCEFDVAWVIMATYGYDVGLDEQLAIVGVDRDPEPWYDESGAQVLIYGGDIAETFCGDYTKNVVSKVRASAMRKVFEAYEFTTKPVREQSDIERCLLKGGLVFMKTTVDFLPYTPATWVATNGNRYPVPFMNDHAVALTGFNRDVVVVRDVLGPTNTNWDRAYEYEVPWDQFWASAEAHSIDGVTVLPPDG